MAERVELNIEDMIPELELMEKLGVFNKDETRVIIKRRKQFEYKLQRVSKSKEDLLRYIQYEMNLMKLVKQRVQEKGLQQKKNNLEYSIVNRLNRLFNNAITRFPSDCKIWLSYIKFCKQVRFYTCVSRLLDQMLNLHGDKPALFKLAAQWEFNDCQSVERARKFIHQGLHVHKDSKLLFIEGFRLELSYANKKLELALKEKADKGDGNNDENNSTPDPVLSDPILKGKLAEVIYDSAVKKINDVSFLIDLLNIAQEYSFTSALQAKIIEGMSQKYPNEEITWDTLARRELELGGTIRERMVKCISVYEQGLQTVPTRKMWSLYLDYVLEINEDTTALPVFKTNCLKNAFIAAHNKNMLSEKYYLMWIKKVENVDTCKVLQWGTERLGTSSKLWSWRLRYHLCEGDEKGALAVFRQIISNPNIPDQINHWMLILKYFHVADSVQGEELWKEAVHNPIVGATLKGRFIEWVAVSRGILAARKAYAQLCSSPPFSLDLHIAMSKLEDAQPKLSLKNARQVYETAINQFGKSNTDVWLWYIKFEEKFGDPINVPKIYERATKTLNSNSVDVFVSEYHLNKAETFNINRYFGHEAPEEVKIEEEEEVGVIRNSKAPSTPAAQEVPPSPKAKKSRDSTVNQERATSSNNDRSNEISRSQPMM